MRVIDSPELPPGHCAISRTDIGPFIDTNIDLDTLPPYGRLYLASSTVADLAQLIGWQPPGTGKRLKDENRVLKDELAAKDEALAAARHALNALQNAGYAPA